MMIRGFQNRLARYGISAGGLGNLPVPLIVDMCTFPRDAPKCATAARRGESVQTSDEDNDSDHDM
jgi:hypothetical protein